MTADPSRLRLGDLVAGASALLLFIFMFFKWYGVEDAPDGFGGLSAWEAFGFIDVLLMLVILGVLAIVAIRLLGVQLPPLPVPLGTILLGLGALAALLILIRLIFPPDPGFGGVSFDDAGIDLTRSVGVFLGFLASLGIVAGGFLSARERGEMIPGVGGAAAGGPLGGGQPGGPLGGGQQYGGQQQYGGGQQQYGGGQPAGGQQYGGGQPVGGATQVGGPGADPGAGAGGATDVGGAGAGGGAAAGGAPKADWYPDPEGKARLRYWDGTQWTDQTAD
jgi:hypothetical protein